MKEDNNKKSKENRSINESNLSGYNHGKELYEKGIKLKER